MFILYSVIISILAGYLAKGRLKHLAGYTLQCEWLAIGSFLVQLVIFSDIPFVKFHPNVTVSIHIASYIMLLVFIFLNRKIPGIIFIGAGIFLNFLVITLNGGYMPTFADKLANTSMGRHADAIESGYSVHNSSGITDSTLLPWLGDIFHLPPWLPFSNVFSIGDIIISAGIFIYFLFCMKPAPSDK